MNVLCSKDGAQVWNIEINRIAWKQSQKRTQTQKKINERNNAMNNIKGEKEDDEDKICRFD